MLSPEYIEALADGAEIMASGLSNRILSMVVERLTARMMSGQFFFTNSDKYQLETLQEAGVLLSDITSIIKKYTGKEVSEIQSAYKKAGIESFNFDAKVYEAANISPIALAQSPSLIRILERGFQQTLGNWANLTRTTALSAQRVYINACDRAYNLVTSGAVPFQQAVMMTLKGAMDTPVVYPSGHVDQLEVATARAVRTGVAQACANVTAERAAEMGVTKFLVSAHSGARPTHEVWQGQVYWVDWNKLAPILNIYSDYPEASEEEKAKYKEFVETTEIGTVTGLCGTNCRHSYMPYFDGMANPYEGMTYDPKAYEISQRQRLLERRIRKTKRELNALKAAAESVTDEATKAEIEAEIRRKTSLLNKQGQGYLDYCEDNDLKPQEDRLTIPD